MRTALIVLAGCGPSWDETNEEGLRHLTGSYRTRSNGQISASFEVEPGETAFAVVAQADPLRVNLPALTGPEGSLYAADTESPRLVTNAGYVSAVAVLAWPILDSHADLEAGDHTVDVGTLASATLTYEQGDVGLDVWLKSDPDFTEGTIDARIVWTDGLETRADLDAIDGAFDTWAEIYAGQGIGVNRVDDLVWAGAAIGQPGETFGSWLAMSSQGPSRVVNLVLVETITGLPQAFGLAGGIPGPVGASGASGVLVSYGLAAGVDNDLSAIEARIFGETLAHETGHYLGLYHPVEIGWDRWDSLGDTPECEAEGECEGLFSTNLMFPYPVCSLRDCTPQDAVTDAQGRGMHRHPLVD